MMQLELPVSIVITIVQLKSTAVQINQIINTTIWDQSQTGPSHTP